MDEDGEVAEEDVAEVEDEVVEEEDEDEVVEEEIGMILMGSGVFSSHVLLAIFPILHDQRVKIHHKMEFEDVLTNQPVVIDNVGPSNALYRRVLPC